MDGKVALSADAQAEALTAMYGWTNSNWRYITILLPAWLLDLISTFGMYLMRTPVKKTAPQKMEIVIAEDRRPEDEQETTVLPAAHGQEVLDHPQVRQMLCFRDECLEPAGGAAIGAQELYKAYQRWCHQRNELALPANMAGVFFGLMFRREADGGKRQYLGFRQRKNDGRLVLVA
jgi:hypothetical protein